MGFHVVSVDPKSLPSTAVCSDTRNVEEQRATAKITVVDVTPHRLQ